MSACLLSQQGLSVQPACVLLCVCVCPMIKQHLSLRVPDCVYSAVCVQSPVGMGHGHCADVACQFFFSFFFFFFSRLITSSHSCVHSEMLCESLHSVFPSDRMHLFLIATVDKMLSDRISRRPVPAQIMGSPLMD